MRRVDGCRTRNREDITVDKTIKVVKVDEETERIVIKNVTRSHAGEYEVVAQNRLGQATSSGKITVNCESLRALPIPYSSRPLSVTNEGRRQSYTDYRLLHPKRETRFGE